MPISQWRQAACGTGEIALDDQHFDALTRSLAGGDTRRRLLRRLGAVSLAGVPLLAAGEGLAKRHKKKKKKKKGTPGTPVCPSCPAGQQCVNGACVATCKPACDGKACGAADGCGGACQVGACPDCQVCTKGACAAAPNDTPCASDNLCAVTTCQAGVCTEVNHFVCNQPQSSCQKATCNPATGNCDVLNQPENYPCDMDEICMYSHGTCNGEGTCVSAPIDCGGSNRECCLTGPSKGQCKSRAGGPCSSNGHCCNNDCITWLGECNPL